ncbi:hypothetical protein SAMN05444921_12552 [Streptomyces wuyuanensis]|uniref:Uncharacterized protein n=2 Tax=Streptomyces wuyuanensis TaxID=1196353 RepID=A0A1H0AU60_9ACTN|nr:hypothetical protein SAMN05444921_12552 [Streptomyces wuyuanensis]
MRPSRKKRVTTLGLGCLVAAGAVFGYLEIFTTGIDRLPDKPCSGAVDRETLLYVPCTPPGKKPGGAREAYALTVDARTIGETRVHGNELRQVLIDFAYQLARHTYEAADCQESRTFPKELPRLPAA